MFYYFYFKWGGSFNPDEPVADPSGQRTYPVPNQNTAAVQVINPKKQAAESILHAWDYRRGYITKTAIKRIQEYQETDTDFQTDADSQAPPKKKYVSRALQYIPEEEEEIQSCLQELFKRKYLPRNTRNTRPQTPHQAAARAAAVNQATPPTAHLKPKEKTENSSTPNRIVRMTLFKPGFEQQTEIELAAAFKRPVRKFKEDTPFYPGYQQSPVLTFTLITNSRPTLFT